ncbi:hypothetical protein [Kordia sp.]
MWNTKRKSSGYNEFFNHNNGNNEENKNSQNAQTSFVMAFV